MARNRVVYWQRQSTPFDYDTLIIADFVARGWMVDVVFVGTYVDCPDLPSEYWDDVHRLVIGGAGSAGTAYDTLYQTQRLTAVRAPIVVLGRQPAVYLGLAVSATSATVSSFTRRDGAPNPPAIVATLGLPSRSSNLITPSASARWDYWAYSPSYAGVAVRDRTVGTEIYQDLFYGQHNIANYGSTALDFWRSYSGGFDLSPRDVRGALVGPLGFARALLRTDTSARGAIRSPLVPLTGIIRARRYARAALRSPMDIPGGLTRGLVATPSQARSALPTPLGWRTARVRVRPSGVAALPTPLGTLAGLAGVGVHARSALGTPLSIFRARVGRPSPTIAPALPTTRPRLLADPLPLRRGTDLPEYRTDAYLPWVYGRVTLSPLPLDAAGLEWLVTDHPILAVTAVRDGEATVSGWALEQRLDATDHPIAVLRLARKPEGALAVSVAGRRHAQSGALIEHPADIAADLCARCGLPAGDWSALRAGWPGVALGSVLADAMPLREALSAVIGAVGARWSGAPLRAWAADSGTVLTTLDAASADDASAEADTASLATRLTVAWGWDWSTNSPRGSVIVEAPEAIARYGEIAAELSAPWLRTARDALALAHAELARRARPKWQIEIQTGPRSDRLRPGDRVDIDHPWLPAGPAEITHIAASSISQRITCEGAAGPVPRTQTVRRGALLDAEAEEPVSVSYRDGIATFTILDELGAPLSNAAVSLDGGRTYNTDRQGRVQIRTARGAYMLEVAAPGYAPMRMEVEV